MQIGLFEIVALAAIVYVAFGDRIRHHDFFSRYADYTQAH